MSYKLGSLFDGSGGFPLAGALCGVEPVWAAEVEPYPIAVTRSRFPNMKHLGDISKVNGGDIEPVDIITFGSPCQDLSVAGKRAGLKHEANGDEETTRSGLFMEAVRIIKEMRRKTNGKYPRFALWENVPGAFSSNNGEDFRIVCEELIKIVEPSASMPAVPQNGWNYADSYLGDGWSLAYRVLDAQYWGVPQRRRRVYLVADFGGECAREILFEREGLRGYFTQGRTPWQTTPADAQGSLGADDREGEGNGGDGRGRQLDDVGIINAIGGNAENSQVTDTFPTLTNGSAPGFGNAVAVPTCTTFILDNIGGQAEYGKASPVNGTLRAGAQGAIAYSFDSLASNSMKSKNPLSGCREVNVAKTLDTTDPNPSKNQGEIAVVEPVFSVENHPADSRVNLDESGKVQTLTGRMGTGGGNVPMVMEPFCKSARGKFKGDAETWKDGKVANTLNTFDQGETRANELVVEGRPNFIDVEMEVAVRKYMVNTDKLVECLRQHKGSLTNKAIAEALDRPITLVEHWFRQDSSFAIPEPEVWPRLKKLLGIETDEFDESLMTFEYKGGTYDMRNRIHIGDTAPTLTCGSGNNLHLLPTEPVICLQGNGIDRADANGCAGKGWREDASYTLNTIDRPAVVYAVDQGGGKSSANVTEDKAPTLCTTHGGEPAVAYLASGKDVSGCLLASGYDKLGGQEMFSGDYTVIEQKPTVCITTGSFTQITEEVSPTLMARDWKDPTCILTNYIVRRLTPTECARLQGFADWWGVIEPKDSLTDEEVDFWNEVILTKALIDGTVVYGEDGELYYKTRKTPYKPKTPAQVLTYYNKLWTDSAEYKMWGNGIALPTALYCVQGIVEALAPIIEAEVEETDDDDWMN